MLVVFDVGGVTEVDKQLERLVWKGAKPDEILSFRAGLFQKSGVYS